MWSKPVLRLVGGQILRALRIPSRAIRLLRSVVFMGGSYLRSRFLPMPDDAEALALLEKDRTAWLLLRLRANLSGAMVEEVRLCDRATEALYWTAMLPERMMNTLSADRLMRLLVKVEPLLRQAVEAAPYFVDAHRLLGRNLWMQGNHQASGAQFTEAENVRRRFALSIGRDPDDQVLLPVNCAHVLGLMGHLDAFFKYRQLTGDTRPYDLPARPDEVVNDAFFSYWKPFMAADTSESLPLRHAAWGGDWNWFMPINGKMMHVHTAIAHIQRQWVERNLPPLLSLRPEHDQELQLFRSTIGMEPQDWFVCLHVRSAAYYDDSAAQDFRNSHIEDYTPAIEAIVAAGGWVLRMGAPSAPPLDSRLIDCGKVIDYAHHTHRSAVLDVALSASCRLFVSVSSGLHTVALAFGRPVCFVNIPMYAGYPWCRQNIFIPKLYYSDRLQRVLSMDEILSSSLIHADHQHLFAKEGIRLIDNTPEEIAQTVLEALNDLGNSGSVEDFASLVEKYDLALSPRLGRFFAKKWENELFPAEDMVC